MQIRPEITCTITDDVTTLLGLCIARANQLEGTTKKEAYIYSRYIAVIDIREDVANILIIDQPQRGFISYPRSGAIEDLPYTEYISVPLLGSMPETKYLPGVRGGWQDGKTLLTTDYIFPLVDADNASFVVSKPGDDLEGEFAGPLSNYGNLYWWNGDDEKPFFLSWRGTPTRHFRLPSTIDIPGFSVFETSSPGLVEDTPIYTTFGTALYQGGKVLADAPLWSWPYNPSGIGGRCLILGACQSTDGSIYIVTQSDHYNAPENVFIFSDGHREEGAGSLKQTYLNGKTGVTCVFEKALTKPGFFLTLWKYGGVVGGWSFITEKVYSRTGLPWFANHSGSNFISSNGDSISTDGTFLGNTKIYGTYKEIVPFIDGSLAHCLATIKSDYTGFDFFEPENKSAISVSFEATTTYYNTDTIYRNMGSSWPEVVAPTDPLVNMYLSGNGTAIEIHGGFAPYTSSIGVVTGNSVSITTGCATSITVTDSCGRQAVLETVIGVGYYSLSFIGDMDGFYCSIQRSDLYFSPDCSKIYWSVGEYLNDSSYMGIVYNHYKYSTQQANSIFAVHIYRKVWTCP